jgi:hypothetical protein
MSELNIRPITRLNASDLAMECLLDLIRRGALRPGGADELPGEMSGSRQVRYAPGRRKEED